MNTTCNRAQSILCRAVGVLACVVLLTGCAAMRAATQRPAGPAAGQGGLPPLAARWDPRDAQVGVAAMPFPKDAPILARAGLELLQVNDVLLQKQVLSPNGLAPPERAILRWIDDTLPDVLTGDVAYPRDLPQDAGWTWRYRLVEESAEEVPWLPAMRNVPLDKTEYEMYQLDLEHGGDTLGVRMGLRLNDRIYWWQFIRADFLQRGPVFDLLRVGGPIYNEESTIQADLYLILYANGLIEAYAHFINNQREGVGTEAHGIPVVAFDLPDKPAVDNTLDGTRAVFDVGSHRISLGQCAAYADAQRPGALRTEDGLVVLQAWMDQEIWGELLCEYEGIPEENIVPEKGRSGTGDGFWVAKLGGRTIPRGMARTLRFTMSPGDMSPEVVRYDAPGWWHAQTGALPTQGYLPTEWWAVPRALEVGGEGYFTPHPRHGPFELGCSGRDQDGTLGAAMLMLGYTTGETRFCTHALLSAYWWADIATDHVDFTVHELPKYSWQWIVQPYMRWTELVYAYWETGDPYLLETAKFTADAYYRFFWTNRPHRFVGRDALPCSGLLALWQATGQYMYLQRMGEIIAEGRRSYGQTDDYWPGHQSGCGPNGVARQPSYDYIPMVLARVQTQYLEAMKGRWRSDEEAGWDFIRSMLELVDSHEKGDWAKRAVDLSYFPFIAMAEHFPDEADYWLDMMNRWNAEMEMPDTHDGGKAYSWVMSAIRFDAWAWGARWEDGTLVLSPSTKLLEDPRAPETARIWTPEGWVTLAYANGEARAVSPKGFPVEVASNREGAH